MASTTQPAFSPRRFYWILGALVAVFGALRFACACNDLWMDEIWSLGIVQPLHSPAEILTQLRQGNNHPLNSLWIYWLGPGCATWTYRMLAWFTGTATVALAGLIGRRQFQSLHPDATLAGASVAGLLVAALVGGSHILIHYSSEARGYGPAIGFGFLAVYALSFASRRPAGGWAAVYGFACVLGLLSHMVAFQVMLAGGVWSLVAIFKHWNNWRERAMHLAGWHLGPGLFLVGYYLGFARKVDLGGGPQLPLKDVLGTLSAFTLGFPVAASAVALLFFLGVISTGLVLLWRRDRALAAFYFTGIFIAPAIGIFSSGFALLYPRYFIMSAALAVLLAGYSLARLWHAGRRGYWIAGVLLAAFLVGNGVHVTRLIRDGRGHYQAALRYIGEQTPAGPILVASDSDFRNFSVMDYYRSAVGPTHQLQYCLSNQPMPEGLQWVFFQRLDDTSSVPPEALHDAAGHNFQLVRVFPHAPLSGWEWYVYRNLDETILPPVRP